MVGFSVNILTLLALVLATGMVVDDAIVVLENIVRRRAEGMGSRAAAVLGTKQVFFAVVTTTATLAAVFVPLSFLPGQTGGLFREFGFTLAFAVLLSSFVALSASAPCSPRSLLRRRRGRMPKPDRGPMVCLGNSRSSRALSPARCAGALAAPAVVIAGRGFSSRLTAVLLFGQIRSGAHAAGGSRRRAHVGAARRRASRSTTPTPRCARSRT
jgi:hydrophobic/amphiphilic exporter-1 (mainly G- bacteria), HAE1 family